MKIIRADGDIKNLGDTAFDFVFFKLVVQSLSIDKLYLNGDGVDMVVWTVRLSRSLVRRYMAGTPCSDYRPKSEELTPVSPVYIRRIT